MTKVSLGSSVIWQRPPLRSSAFFSELNASLQSPDLKGFTVCVAYARWKGICDVAANLHDFIARGGNAKFIFGIKNGVTTPDALTFVKYLTSRFPSTVTAFGYDEEYNNVTFHPKIYRFEHTSFSKIIIGSPNFTDGGLHKNHEIAVKLIESIGSEVDSTITDYIKQYEHSSKNITESVIAECALEGARENILAEKHSYARKTSKRFDINTKSRKDVTTAITTLESELPTTGTTSTSLIEKIGHALTQKPKYLFLEVLGETGSGHQIQVPTATVGAFFSNDQEQNCFEFPEIGVETIVRFSHFGNNTHRFRLLPIKKIKRPLVIQFKKVSTHHFICKVLTKSKYHQAIKSFCINQTRAGSRRWGFYS